MNDVASFTVTRTKRDYFDAIWQNAVRSPAFWIVIAISPLINGAITLFYSIDEPIGVGVVFAIAVIMLGSFVLVFAALLSCYYLAAQNAWRSPGFLRPIALEFSDAGLKASSEVGAGDASWVVFNAAFESRSLIVLRQRPGSLLILPKRDADHDALTRLRILLRAHVKKTNLMGGET